MHVFVSEPPSARAAVPEIAPQPLPVSQAPAPVPFTDEALPEETREHLAYDFTSAGVSQLVGTRELQSSYNALGQVIDQW